MSGSWLVVLLIFLNIPVLIFLLWVMFDDVRESHGQFLWGVAKALLSVVSFGLFRKFFLDDEDNSFVNSLGVLAMYAAIIAGEYWVISAWFPTVITSPFSIK